MPPKWQYPRWRRALMQGTMWFVLAGTLGLAALYANRQSPGVRMPLGEARSFESLTFRLPAGWDKTSDPKDDPTVIARATEPGGGLDKRTVSVRVVRLSKMMSPIEFLARNGLPTDLAPADYQDLIDPNRQNARSVMMAGQPGVITGGTAAVRGTAPDGEQIDVPHRTYFAVAVLPSRVAILLTLEGVGPAETDDVDILAHLATSMELKDNGGGTGGHGITSSSVQLPGGLIVPVPSGFGVVKDEDPNRTMRTLASLNTNAATIVDLIQCNMTGADTDVDRVGMAELHEWAFHGGSLVALPGGNNGMQQWEIRPATEILTPYLLRGYLTVDRSGNALLAIFRGDARRNVSFNEPWQAIASGLVFDKPADLAPLIKNGERAVAKMREVGLEKLVGTGERWWLWFRDGQDPLMGWSMDSVSTTGGNWTGVKRSVWRDNRTPRRFRDRWEDDAAMRSYSRNSNREPMAGDTVVQSQYARINGKKLAIDSTAARNLRTQDARVTPTNFIPGPWLALALGQLGDEPIVVRTDCFPGFEPALKGGLMTLLIEPSDEFQRPAEDGSGPMRCLTVKVNGSGEISRWYFTPDKQVAQVDFIGGLHRKPSDEKYINYTFGDDVGLRP